MTGLRFDFQTDCVERALDENREGLVLNVGCCTDPGRLKDIDPARVINCDLSAVDEKYEEENGKVYITGSEPNATDVLFDAARDHWPFDDHAAVLVVLGDILEHLSVPEIRWVLFEARMVSSRLCVTVPEDDRDETNETRAGRYRRGAVHRTIVSEKLLRELLGEAGWRVIRWDHPMYDSGQFWGKRVMGHFVEAE